MILPKQKLEQIIAYLDGTMSPSEEKAFEQLLCEDPKLERIVREQRLADSIFFSEDDWMETEFDADEERSKEYFDYYTNSENQEFFSQLQQIQPKKEENNVFSVYNLSFNITKFASVAAVIAIAILFSPALMQSSSSQKLYTKFSNYESLLDFTMKGSSEDKLVIAEQFFEEQNYKLATPLFADLLEQGDQRNDLLRIYFAICLAESERPELAVEVLNEIIDNEDSLYRMKAKYYAGLFYLKNDNREEALNCFEDYIAAQETERLQYLDEAERLVKKLK